jgi:hypothetical protein
VHKVKGSGNINKMKTVKETLDTTAGKQKQTSAAYTLQYMSIVLYANKKKVTGKEEKF